jgi:nucleotide-binding universal stress UspA family protein
MELKKLSNCEVIVFHSVEHEALPIDDVYQVPSYGGPIQQVMDNSNLELQRVREVYETRGKTILGRAEEIFSEQGLKVDTRIVYEHSALSYIRKTVAEENIDLVIVGSKGVHSLAEEIFVGSLSDRVLRHVPCDVLVIR